MTRGRSPWFYIFIAWIATLVTGAFVTGTMEAGEDFLIPALLVIAVLGVVLLRGPVGHALAAMLRGERTETGVDDAVLAEVDELRMRLGEMEERLDFTERLLAMRTNGELVPGRESADAPRLAARPEERR